MDPGTILKAVDLFLKSVKWIHRYDWGRDLYFYLRSRALKQTGSVLHEGFCHAARRFAVNTSREGIEAMDAERLLNLVNGCRNVVSQFLYVEGALIHSTIKLIGASPSGKHEDLPVMTIARSTPLLRPAEFKPTSHLVGKNSAFASLLGCPDGNTIWPREPYSVFHCSDLTTRSAYACTRERWQQYYKTALVLPLRYDRSTDLRHVFFGFLTFDSNIPNTFKNVPDIYDHLGDKCGDYKKKLDESSLVDLGGILADSLATILYLLSRNAGGNTQ